MVEPTDTTVMGAAAPVTTVMGAAAAPVVRWFNVPADINEREDFRRWRSLL